MSEKIRAKQELRALISKAGHIPLWKPSMAEKEADWVCAGCGSTDVSATIDGKLVTLKGRMVARNTLDGPAPCFTFAAFVDGVRVNRTQLVAAFAERLAPKERIKHG